MNFTPGAIRIHFRDGIKLHWDLVRRVEMTMIAWVWEKTIEIYIIMENIEDGRRLVERLIVGRGLVGRRSSAFTVLSQRG